MYGTEVQEGLFTLSATSFMKRHFSSLQLLSMNLSVLIVLKC